MPTALEISLGAALTRNGSFGAAVDDPGVGVGSSPFLGRAAIIDRFSKSAAIADT